MVVIAARVEARIAGALRNVEELVVVVASQLVAADAPTVHAAVALAAVSTTTVAQLMIRLIVCIYDSFKHTYICNYITVNEILCFLFSLSVFVKFI